MSDRIGVMLKKLEKILHVESLIKPGDKVLCAVSGGADSVALLVMLKRLSGPLSFDLSAAHLDHCLRAESGDDAKFVEKLCGSLDVPLTAEVVDIRALASERGEGLEAAGRHARRRFLERVAQEHDCTSVALAHHSGDQAETVLFRLLRGSGLSGLAAMQPRSGVYIRPLLSFKKVELRTWLNTNEVEWREDASNLDSNFSRNRIRNEIMPELLKINQHADDAICRLSHQVSLEEEFWKDQVGSFLQRHLAEENGEAVLSLSVDSLQSIHRALRRRVLRGVLERVRGDLRQIDSCHVDQIEALLESDKPQAETFLPGAWVARRYGRLKVSLEPPVVKSFDLSIDSEGEYALPYGGRLIVTVQAASMAGADVVEFCPEQISFPLNVRSVRPGDRFQPSGMNGHKRLKDYFIDNKVSHENRRKALIVSSDDKILWLVGERRCEGFNPDFDKPVLQIRFERSVFVDE